MRIAVISDIHGNAAAFEAVLADLKETSPDLILHGGDLAASGSSPVEVIDRIRALGWRGVMGNTDEMLALPETLEEFARGQAPSLQPTFAAVREMATEARAALGEERLAWLGALPSVQIQPPIALVHASPASLWRAPGPEASDEELARVYAPLDQSIAVYGHIHHPFIRRAGGRSIANSGAVSLSYDGDPRASYLVIDGGMPSIRRVDYDVEREIAALHSRRISHADWVGKMLRAARPVPL